MPLAKCPAAARLALVLPLFAGPALAATPTSALLNAAAGPWEIALQGTAKKCGLVLRLENASGVDHVAGIPAGCRRAIPGLAGVRGWTADDKGEIVFDAKPGEPELTFAREEGGRFVATGANGETYDLTPTGNQKAELARVATAAAEAAKAAAAKPAKPPEPTTTAAITKYPGKVPDLAGRYVILREGVEGGKDVGCMLTLDDRTRGPGGYKAHLAPACRDNGIVIFNPVGWNFDGRGRLILTAEKGHSASFEYHADGGWWKDPKEGGKPLGVRHF
jgi:hypothetical protein